VEQEKIDKRKIRTKEVNKEAESVHKKIRYIFYEYIGEEKTMTKASERRREHDRENAVRAKKILIIAAAVLLLVLILFFAAGRSWQRGKDKKEIENLNSVNANLQTQIQSLQKENQELKTQATTNNATQNTNTTANTNQDTNSTTTGNTHVLKEAYNFREESNVDSDILAELDEGTSIQILQVLSDNWVQATYNGVTGYIKCGDELDTTAVGSGTSESSGDTEDSTEDGTVNPTENPTEA
jgi:type II secretory pathway pseudopilin PulG